MSAAFVAGVSLVFMLQVGSWARVSTLADIIFVLYVYYRLGPSFCTACCPGPQSVVNLLASVKH